MKTRKEKILATALKLFAKQGYEQTPTNQVSTKAEVSEGLLFKHYMSKEGLLNAIFDAGQAKTAPLRAALLEEKDPELFLSMYMDYPLLMHDTDKDFWRLNLSLMFEQAPLYATLIDKDYDKTLDARLRKAFDEADYADPDGETDRLKAMMIGYCWNMLHKPKADHRELIDFLKLRR